ncbi:hypothetical protein FLAVO9AF_420015 [Flavobacterium sp. 9AF]|uniref:hypothetical protein n=1 Tax=Flavobacterium sp. 9AF TaxID=2653142 RepID=UPI0012F4746D|nr:hypothetical protein [Flavobacterium sp. 9AF]VXC01243.1 hypothetical protein FLAVO9AF_420015 [Flavobacterium sp. 9AF]
MKKSILNLEGIQLLSREQLKQIEGKGETTFTECINGQLVSTTIVYRDNNGDGRLNSGDTIERVYTITIGYTDQQMVDDENGGGKNIGGC